jgi:hypothetical protein
MKFTSDVDIDLGDRSKALALIKHTPAGIIRDGQLTRHNTGVYVTGIPVDPFIGCASIDYKVAESRGYIKLDLLNVNVYSHVTSNQHLDELMNTEPPWDKLYDPEFCSKLIHIGSHYKTLISMPEAVNSIERMAMFLAVIRPAKRYLIGEKWEKVSHSVWNAMDDNSYYFKKAHGIAYSYLVAVHMNLLSEQGMG